MSELIQIPFRAGIDEGADPKQLPPGTLKLGENCRQDKSGRVRKRFGILPRSADDIASAAEIAADRIIRGGSALTVADATDLAVAASSAWKRIDRIPSLASTFTPVADTTRTTSQATTHIPALLPNVRVTVYSTGLTGYSAPANGALYVVVEDHETGAILMPPTLVSSSANYPRIFGNGQSGLVYICYVTATGELSAKPLNVLVLSGIGPAVTLKTGVSIWDGVMLDGIATICFAAVTATGVHIERGAIATGVMTHTANPAGAATYTAIAIDVGSTIVNVVFSMDLPQTYLTTYLASNLTAIAAPFGLVGAIAQSIGVKDLETGFALVVMSWIDPTLFYLKTMSYVVDQTTIDVILAAGNEITHHIAVASRIFTIGTRYFVAATVAVVPPAIAVSNDTDVSPQSVVIIELQPDTNTLTTKTPHRRAGTLEARTSALQLNVVTQTPTDDEGRVHLAIARKQREPARGTEALPLSAVLHRVESRGEDWGAAMTLGPSALVAASSPFWSDGASTYPYGFAHEPDIVAWSVGAGGSGSMAAGTYLYCCVFEWRDARGVLHRSAPSAVVTVTGVNASGSVVLRVACTSVDPKQSLATGFGSSSASPVRIALYRSEVGGPILYRLTHEPTYNVTFNDPLSATVVITDTRADANITGTTPTLTLASRPQLYTNNELAEVNPGAATTGTTHRGRAWLLSGDRRTLQFSKKVEEDAGIAAGFNEEFILVFTSDKHWLASLDDKLIAGGEHIDAVFGDGPASDGTGIDWQIQRIHSDASCTTPRSVAVIPPGLIFRSPRGFELLDRGLNVAYIGGPVEDTLATYPVVTSAVVVPEEQEVRFTCTNEDGDEGVVIVLHYGYRAWYVRKYWRTGSSFDRAFVDAAYVAGTYYLVGADGIVYAERSDSFLDSNTFVSMKVSVPVYPTGPGGWHRLRCVQIVGESKTHHRLFIEASRDFIEAYEQQKIFEDGSTVTTPGPLEQARMTLRHQKRQAAVITIYDSVPLVQAAGNGEGPILSALDVYFEPKQGPAKLAAAKKG